MKCLVTELGADVNQSHTDSGSTPIVIAAQNEHLDMLACLLEVGADVDKADNE
jgi:ankyrin repeat protein